MKAMLSRAQAVGREVIIEVFTSTDGQPLLIYPTLSPSLNHEVER